MKKSTIIILEIVYVVAFFLIGLLGQAVRAYDPVIYPEAIELVEPNGIATVYKDYANPENPSEILFNYYFVVRPYEPDMTITLKAQVVPVDTTYPTVNFLKDESDISFDMDTIENNPSVELNYAIITPKQEPDPFLTARFTVASTNPGTQIKLIVGVTFVNI